MHTAPAPDWADDVPLAERIEELMAMPVKDRPAVIIVGDDDLAAFDPPRPDSP